MTIHEAIERADGLVANSIPHPQKIRWLTSLEGRIRRELLDTHYGGERAAEEAGGGLLIGAPWEESYLYHLAAMTALTQGDTTRYNEYIALFRSLYDDFADHYRRTHLPVGGTFRY